MEKQLLSQQFKEKGYITLPGLISPKEASQLLQTILNAKQCERGRDRLNENGLVFNHNLYYHNPEIQAFVSQQKIIDILTPLIGPDFWIHWDQLVTKKPGGVEFPWHQDNGYNGLKDEHFQLWIALSDSNPQNGGLWVSPGSHKKGRLPHVWKSAHKVYKGEVRNEVAITAVPGDAIVFSSLLLHRTKPNNTDTLRYAYVVEYMSVKHFHPRLSAPYFMVAKDGLSKPGFQNTYAGRKNPFVRLRYPGFYADRAKQTVKKFLRSKP